MVRMPVLRAVTLDMLVKELGDGGANTIGTLPGDPVEEDPECD